MDPKSVTLFAAVLRRRVRAFFGHHVDQDGAVLGAVNTSALRADRERECARLRALTAPPRSAVSWQLHDGRGVVEFDADFLAGVSCGYLVGVDHDTPSALPNAERAAAASQDPDRSAHSHKPTRRSDVRPRSNIGSAAIVQRQRASN